MIKKGRNVEVVANVKIINQTGIFKNNFKNDKNSKNIHMRSKMKFLK